MPRIPRKSKKNHNQQPTPVQEDDSSILFSLINQGMFIVQPKPIKNNFQELLSIQLKNLNEEEQNNDNNKAFLVAKKKISKKKACPTPKKSNKAIQITNSDKKQNLLPELKNSLPLQESNGFHNKSPQKPHPIDSIAIEPAKIEIPKIKKAALRTAIAPKTITAKTASIKPVVALKQSGIKINEIEEEKEKEIVVQPQAIKQGDLVEPAHPKQKRGRKCMKKIKKEDSPNVMDFLLIDQNIKQKEGKQQQAKQKGNKKQQKQERKTRKQKKKQQLEQFNSYDEEEIEKIDEFNDEEQKQCAGQGRYQMPDLLKFCHQPPGFPDEQGHYHINFFQPQSRQRIQEQLQQSNQQINQLIASYPQFFQNQPSYQSYMHRQYNLQEFSAGGFMPFQARPINNLEQNEQYYKKADQPPEVIKTYDKNEPYMKIIVQKANCNDIQNEEHILTQRGLVGSLKNTICEDIVIGRQQSLVNQTHPNDIILPANDRAISRIHCKINYKDGFKNKQGFKIRTKIIDQFVAFLMNAHPRLGAHSPFRDLPKHLFARIWQFHKAPRKFYISDIGSIFGTFIKIKPNYVYLLEKGQNFLIGADIQFWIAEAYKFQGPMSSEQIENEEFLNYLAIQQKQQTKLHGFTPQIENKINQYTEQIITTENVVPQELEGKPMLKIELSQAPTAIHSRHIFVATEENQEFKIGRAQNCDILINHNTISRKQCRLHYIFDGDSQRESANGTWLSLTDFTIKEQRQQSSNKELKHDSEIKISETILKVEIYNND